jgi:hypothetical protein
LILARNSFNRLALRVAIKRYHMVAGSRQAIKRNTARNASSWRACGSSATRVMARSAAGTMVKTRSAARPHRIDAREDAPTDRQCKEYGNRCDDANCGEPPLPEVCGYAVQSG